MDFEKEARTITQCTWGPASSCYHLACVKTAASLREAYRLGLEDAAKQVPTSWLDPILTGPTAVNVKDCPSTERVLLAVRDRIVAKAAALKETVKESK
jgi:hypothetical protein